jgi:phosphoribosylaminoimidazolecarboxamide formyltransferase / IMP cyclohydrolase
MKIKTALISVSDKTGLVSFAKGLVKRGVQIYSTGGTQALLKKNKIPVSSVSKLTGYPELLGGRVKTLHPKVHGGLLYLRSNATQAAEAKRHGITRIDLVVVNLYPFGETVRAPKVTTKRAVEQIDIGGPTMIRSGAKNFEAVTVVCDPNDYATLLQSMKKGRGQVTRVTRRELALKAFRHTSSYDQEIARYFEGQLESNGDLPKTLDVVYERAETLRYGENPHQRAAIYKRRDDAPKFSFEQLHGKQLSFNNILDFEATVDILREFRKSAACVVKHNNPCGIAENPDLALAASEAIDCDSLSAFGGIVGVNKTCDEQVAKQVLQQLPFFEIIVAPKFGSKALALLKTRKNLRILAVPNMHQIGPYDLRFTKVGVLLQDRNRPVREQEAKLKRKLRWATKAKLKPSEIDDLIFAWKCVKVVRSNAIVLTTGKKTIGIGGGQMSRVDSVKIACMKAGEKSWGAFLASDAFFPMADNIEVAHKHGIRAIIQPGGSIRDPEVIEACNRLGIAMAFTGARHFKH